MTPSEAITKLNPMSAKYLPHDVTGDGKPETFCNLFISDVADECGAKLPEGMVNEVVGTFLLTQDGRDEGWAQVDAVEARFAANREHLVLVAWVNELGHGHIALVIPSVGEELRIAQAGRTNSANMPIAQGFGSYPVRFFVFMK